MRLNGIEYYYIRNAQGDIIGLFDKSGTQVVSYVYDSWGKVISTTGTLALTVGVKNPYLYRGYRYDDETGLYYLQSRYYNPEWCRFINADATGGKLGALLSHNLYTYCLNNPVNMEDLRGYLSKFIKALGTIIVGVVIIAGALAGGAVAVTAGAMAVATANLIIGIGTVVVGIAKTVAAVAGAKEEAVDKINVRDNIINTFMGEDKGEKVSAAIDVGMVSVGSLKGAYNITKVNSKSVANSSKALLNSIKNIKPALKKPITYMKAWDNYSTAGGLVEGLHNLNLISNKTYNKLILIFNPDI